MNKPNDLDSEQLLHELIRQMPSDRLIELMRGYGFIPAQPLDAKVRRLITLAIQNTNSKKRLHARHEQVETDYEIALKLFLQRGTSGVNKRLLSDVIYAHVDDWAEREISTRQLLHRLGAKLKQQKGLLDRDSVYFIISE